MIEFKNENEGYQHILNIVDVYSSFTMAVKLKTKTAVEVIGNLKNVCMLYGFPKILQYDNGKEFVNSEMENFLNEYKITKKNSRPRNPQTNGQVELNNQTLIRWIQKRLYEEKDIVWIKYIDEVKYSYNISRHEGKRYSPFHLFMNTPGFNTVKIEINLTLNIEEATDKKSVTNKASPEIREIFKFNFYNSYLEIASCMDLPTNNWFEENKKMIKEIQNLQEDIVLKNSVNT